MAQVLGLDAKLWIAEPAADGSEGTYAVVNNVRNVSLSLETAEADVTTRANEGWRATTPTLKDASIEFEMIYDTDDTDGFGKVQAAFLGDSDLWVKVLDGGTLESDGSGLVAKCRVTNFSINQSLEEAVTASVSLKPTSGTAPTWQ